MASTPARPAATPALQDAHDLRERALQALLCDDPAQRLLLGERLRQLSGTCALH